MTSLKLKYKTTQKKDILKVDILNDKLRLIEILKKKTTNRSNIINSIKFLSTDEIYDIFISVPENVKYNIIENTPPNFPQNFYREKRIGTKFSK